MKVSVIVPIYGVKNFIERCAESLFQQTLDDVEFIFVNDATLDKSMDVLQQVIARYPSRKQSVKIVTHSCNKGLPAARNTGLAIATGDYVFHCDSDDFADSDMLSDLYSKAIDEDADIVWCDWFLSSGGKDRYMNQPEYKKQADALRAILGGAMKYNVWNKLVKRDIYVNHSISFPEGYGMGEDMTMIMLFSLSRKVSYVPKAYYHYVKDNTNSFCQVYSAKHLVELKHNVERIEIFIHQTFGNAMELDLAFFKLEVKFPFLISDGSRGRYRLWKEWFPEANPFIMQNVNVPLRSRLVQWCASKNLFVLVWIYYQIVMRFIYKALYH